MLALFFLIRAVSPTSEDRVTAWLGSQITCLAGLQSSCKNHFTAAPPNLFYDARFTGPRPARPAYRRQRSASGVQRTTDGGAVVSPVSPPHCACRYYDISADPIGGFCLINAHSSRYYLWRPGRWLPQPPPCTVADALNTGTPRPRRCILLQRCFHPGRKVSHGGITNRRSACYTAKATEIYYRHLQRNHGAISTLPAAHGREWAVEPFIQRRGAPSLKSQWCRPPVAFRRGIQFGLQVSASEAVASSWRGPARSVCSLFSSVQCVLRLSPALGGAAIAGTACFGALLASRSFPQRDLRRPSFSVVRIAALRAFSRAAMFRPAWSGHGKRLLCPSAQTLCALIMSLTAANEPQGSAPCRPLCGLSACCNAARPELRIHFAQTQTRASVTLA